MTCFNSTLYDVKNGKKIWIAESTTQAGGTLFMSDQTQIKSFIGGLVSALKTDGHL
jgi:hypothetical protein